MDRAQTARYFAALEHERRRAWNRHGLILLTGLEFNRPRVGPGGAQRLLAVELHTPIDPALPWDRVVQEVHDQDGLVCTRHPQVTWWSGTPPVRRADATDGDDLPGIDAWDIRGLTSPLAAGQAPSLPLIASSNLHQPKHLRSWKTLLFCDKDPQRAIECIRQKWHISMAYFDGPNHLTRRDPPLNHSQLTKRVPDLGRLPTPASTVPAVQLTPAR